MQPGLSFEQAPPFSAPLRFFLTAPLFAILAALLLLYEGPQALASRWAPPALALTHLLTLGFMAMVMMGAMLQMLPVVAGSRVPKPLLVASAVHATLTAGALALAFGLLLLSPPLLRIAAVVLGACFLVFIVAAGYSVAKAPAGSATVIAMALALAALAVTVGLGVMLASALGGAGLSISIPRMTDLHLGWGLLGWVGLLVIGVAYQVVPMFQMTPPYPRIMANWLAKTLFALLALWSAAGILLGDSVPWVALGLEFLAAAGFVLFALATLRLQRQRKRRQTDATTLFWRTGMASIIACALLWSAARLAPALAEDRAYSLLLGVVALYGFGFAVINGMLYKIVPFLAWFHLQSMAPGRSTIPNVKEILPDAAALRQLWAYWAAGGLLIAAAAWPEPFAYPAGIALAVSSAWLWANLMSCRRIYRSTLAALARETAGAIPDAARGS
ncbi:MAG: hypothetical protein HYU77_04200 [Betaproteobacteria bacterium]|nr:hypothetical protein [Betaproteobacteria bacterium]